MRKTIAILFTLAALSAALESQAQQKIRLTDEELAGRIPAGIIRTRPAQAQAVGTLAVPDIPRTAARLHIRSTTTCIP